MNKLISAVLFSLSIGGSLFLFTGAATAATLFFSPASGTFAVGKTFTVNVLVSSSDQAANAYSSTVSFPTDLLEMTGISKSGSVVNLWVQEPSYSAGTANFEGVTFNPGYKGGGAKIVSLTFKAKAEGTAVLRFIGGSVLANDGEGTNILTGRGSGTYTIGAVEALPEAPGKPVAPRITSPTHADPDKWYSVSDAVFKWGLQSGVDAVSILVDQSPASDPGTSSKGLLSTYSVPGVKDGSWYFHLRVRNKNGWSTTSHFRFQIDTRPPDSFTITESLQDGQADQTHAFTFEATDSGSGIDQYEVWIDDGATSTWRDDGSHLYRTPSLGPGAHTLHAKAFDKAGNFLERQAAISAQILVPPRFTDYPRTAYAGDTLVLKGMTYPNSLVTVWLQKDGGQAYSQQIMSDPQGKFTFVSDEKLAEGYYLIWATVADTLRNNSGPSETITIPVKPPPFDLWGWFVRFVMENMCIILNLLLLLLLAYVLRRYYLLTRRLRKGVYGALEALNRAFDLLKEDIQDQINILEKARTQRELTIEEGRILKRLKRDLKVAEKNIRREINQFQKHI